MALSTAPDALRVAIPFSSASNVGSASAQPSGSSRCAIRSNSAARSGSASRQARKRSSHSAWTARPRSMTLRACSRTSSGTSKDLAGSRPMTFLVLATSSRALPWALPVFWASGAGQAMIVRSAMNDGLSVTASAARYAASRAATFSSYRPSSSSQLTRWVCQPYASYRCTMSSLNAMIVLSSIEM